MNGRIKRGYDMKNILITNQNNDFEKELAAIFAAEGYRVFCGDDMTADAHQDLPLDIFIDTTNVRLPEDNFTLEDGVDAGVIEHTFRENALKPMTLLEKYLPRLDAGQGKRLCWISSASASINETRDVRGYGYNMAKAAQHQFIQMVSNRLTREGYSFRVFDPMAGDVAAKAAAGAAFHYFTRRRGTENHDPRRDDENHLTLYDALGRAHRW
jgi:NAD(P)-dependent dehydrogenase (short-subunit alcohol dehydrogenase family)